MTSVGFSGSYAPGDVTFLLTQIAVAPMADLQEKERLIQGGHTHYSEMLTPEQLPAPEYLALFRSAVARHLPTMARDLLQLASAVRQRHARPVLVSLARAGTPIGVALRHVFASRWGMDVPHYSISILRGRGIDRVALAHLCAQHDPASLVFVDGWTGKGAITAELHASVAGFNAAQGTQVSSDLFVLVDLAGSSAGHGSTEDYLIPSAILNATVSGLVSRTVLNASIAPDQFHGCVLYQDLRAGDMSQWFVAQLLQAAAALPAPVHDGAAQPAQRRAAALRCTDSLHQLRAAFAVRDDHCLKVGIGETTRAMLRRAPRALCLQRPDDADTAHLRWLAQTRGIDVNILSSLPLKAAAVIKDLRHV
ncbi:cysteine protease StiP domain-containing protein [Xanthomonas nasturtii]|uniref:cysteine protease StiP domain-containing protein n=1 Tax=Xanthomonas nasturtii TaxID=1843581 RepID=UPI002B230A6E|nr:cysteine protease StiP domain-containing protein [Xanthomonas nasturtii]MEA9579761.1 cysteine protease StiP domain-containing protein [Xanthomonas nasturtii]